MMQVSIPHDSFGGGFIVPAAGEAGRTKNQEAAESSEAGVRSHTNTSKELPVASTRLVVQHVGIGEKGPNLRPQLGIGFSEWLLEWCEAIDLRAAIETESEG